MVDVYVWSAVVQELEKKISHTTPFKNLKKIMINKNDQLKQLLARIAKFAVFSLKLVSYDKIGL